MSARQSRPLARPLNERQQKAPKFSRQTKERASELRKEARNRPPPTIIIGHYFRSSRLAPRVAQLARAPHGRTIMCSAQRVLMYSRGPLVACQCSLLSWSPSSGQSKSPIVRPAARWPLANQAAVSAFTWTPNELANSRRRSSSEARCSSGQLSAAQLNWAQLLQSCRPARAATLVDSAPKLLRVI